MGKYATWAACGAVAMFILWGGILADSALGIAPAASLVALIIAAAYLYGTFAASSSLFGSPRRIAASPGTLALTFDDGPHPQNTLAIATMLHEAGHRATFFVLGRHARQHPETLRQVAALGHEIASHGDDHRLLAFALPRTIRRQLKAAESAITDAIGTPPARLFRAPHGVRSPWLAHTLHTQGYQLCAWTVGVFDTAQPGVDVIASRVSEAATAGTVVLLHDADGSGRNDSRQQTVDAVPAIIAALEAAGLRSAALGELEAADHGGNRSRQLVATPIIGIVLVAAVLAFFDRATGGGAREALTHIDPLWLVAAVAANALSASSKVVLWKLACSAYDALRGVPLRLLVAPTFVAFMVNALLVARSGEVVRCVLLQRRLRDRDIEVPMSQIASSVAAEQLLMAIGMVTCAASVAPFVDLPPSIRSVLLGAGAVLVVVAAALALVARRLRRNTSPEAERGPVVRLALMIAEAAGEAGRVLHSPLRIVGALLLGTLAWLLQGVGTLALLHAFGFDATSWQVAAALVVTSATVSIAPIVPGNVGVFPAACALVLSAYDVPAGEALAFAVVLQLCESGVGIALGAVALVVTHTPFAAIRAAGARSET